jgi:hypothetical protein
MLDKQIYLHIGLPKCASTSIQFALYSCENMDFGGLQPIHKVGKFWLSDDLTDLFDCELRFNVCEVEKSRNILMEYIKKSNKTKIAFSSENISLRFLPWDVPTWHKLHFICQSLPAKSCYLFVYKSPYKMLVSLYKEWVLLGYAASFEVFCNEIYKLRQFSFFNDILLGNFLNKFDSIFPVEVLTIAYADTSSFEFDLSQFFGEKIILPSKAKNVSITNEECEWVVNFNRKHNDYNGFFDMLELHRIDRDWEDSRKYANARKRRIRKIFSAEMAKYAKLQNVEYKIPDFIAEIITADLAKLQCTNDNRINGAKIGEYLTEIASMVK